MTEEGTTKQQDEMYCSSCGALIKKDVQFCPQCGARAGAAPGTIPLLPQKGGVMAAEVPTFEQMPIRITFQYPERMSRWLLWFKWLLIIPHQIVLFFYGLAVFVTTFIAWWAILFALYVLWPLAIAFYILLAWIWLCLLCTAAYPRGLYNFVAAVLAWQQRAYSWWFLLRDDWSLFGTKGVKVVESRPAM